MSKNNFLKTRSAFPFFDHYPKYSYLDNAATTHKLYAVIDALQSFLSKEYATIHRGVYRFSQTATDRYEQARHSVKLFIHAKYFEEIVFTKGSTESLNLLANGIKPLVKEGQQILISEIEHHANWVPWQRLAEEKKLVLKTIPVLDSGLIDCEALNRLLENDTALVSVAYLSNIIGIVQPVEQIIKMAHAKGALVSLDGAQSTAHFKVDVQALDCDFYCFSGHKLYGPTGIGVFYAKKSMLEKMQPYQLGGDMIDEVFLENSSYAPLPNRFEAGTPAIAEAIALKAAIDFLQEIGFDALERHEKQLTESILDLLLSDKDIRVIGDPNHISGIVSFVIKGVHPHDVGTIFDENNVAIRAGHHCSQPAMRRFGVSATNRVSVGCYNSLSEINYLDNAIKKVKDIFL